ncbi:unnamed protein product [Effrenium voratum]|uniref:subtilisin n=1 Tax=Effrenium voratum TaxID=2562239 RepID=A0AA36JR46_9DINO|nr:unnamed protein product [Effrenium voratum]
MEPFACLLSRPSRSLDISRPRQWGTQRVGFAGAWAQLEALTTTPSDVVVALIDTGMNFNHEDLQGRFWVNTGEIPGNGVDDDFNGALTAALGFVDDVNGFNIVATRRAFGQVSSSSSEQSTFHAVAAGKLMNRLNGSPVDDGGHGTHNAGIIAAQLNNLGVAGAAGRNQHIKLMVVKARMRCSLALTSQGGYKSDAIEALNYAMAMGAEISSNSWGGHSESPAMQSAIQSHLEYCGSIRGVKHVYKYTYKGHDAAEFHSASSLCQDIVSYLSLKLRGTYLGNMQYSSLTGTSFGTSIALCLRRSLNAFSAKV